jgi:hypothetical protein
VHQHFQRRERRASLSHGSDRGRTSSDSFPPQYSHTRSRSRINRGMETSRDLVPAPAVTPCVRVCVSSTRSDLTLSYLETLLCIPIATTSHPILWLIISLRANMSARPKCTGSTVEREMSMLTTSAGRTTSSHRNGIHVSRDFVRDRDEEAASVPAPNNLVQALAQQRIQVCCNLWSLALERR